MYTGPQSGKFGVIHNQGLPITHMFNWVLNEVHTPETYYASNTFWGASRNPGVNDWNATFDVFDGRWIAFPGEYLKCLEFFTAPTTGVYGNPGTTYAGQGIVDSNTITWTWGADQSLTQNIAVSANGCVAPRNRVIDDLTAESPTKMCGLKLEWALGQSPQTWAQIENVQSAALTLSAANPTYVNSSTGCCTHRRPGNIDWSLTITFTDHRAIQVTRDDYVSFRLWDNVALIHYWELIYGIFSGTSNIVANRQTGEIQQQTQTYMMDAYADDVLGSISRYDSRILPNPTVLWPPVATVLSTPTAPGKPGGAQQASTYNVDLTWAPESSADADGYTIWAGKGDATTAPTDYAVVGCSDTDSFKDVGVMLKNLTSGPEYWYYKINAFNAQGQGPFSEVSDPIAVTPL